MNFFTGISFSQRVLMKKEKSIMTLRIARRHEPTGAIQDGAEVADRSDKEAQDTSKEVCAAVQPHFIARWKSWLIWKKSTRRQT